MLNKFLKLFKENKINRKLDDIFDDSEDIYKKYKIKYIDHGIGFTRKEKKHNDWVDEVLNKEREKNYEETGIKETDSEREKREHDNEQLKKYQKKYGEEIGEKLHKGELWVGMTVEMLEEVKGKPGKKTETISRNKKREELFFDGYKNRQGNMSYKFKVVIINGKLEKWTTS